MATTASAGLKGSYWPEPWQECLLLAAMMQRPSPPLTVSLWWVSVRDGWMALLFRVEFKWRLQENRFFLVFGLIIHFMATTTKAKRCIFISRTPKCPGYRSILNKSRRYRLFSALLRSQFGPIWISSPGCLKQQCCVFFNASFLCGPLPLFLSYIPSP